MTNKRRTLLKGTLATTALGAAAATGLIAPRLTLAAWPKDAFKADDAGDVVSRLFGTADHTASSDIKVKRIGAAIGDLQQARSTVKSQGRDMLKSVRPLEIEAATKLLIDIDAALDPGIAALSENVAQGSVQERSALDRASSSVVNAASMVRPGARESI